MCCTSLHPCVLLLLDNCVLPLPLTLCACSSHILASVLHPIHTWLLLPH